MNSKAAKRKTDSVDVFLDQWARERPDLNIGPMGLIGRVKRCALLLEQSLDANLAKFGLSLWEFDMLATLRRAGAPYRLSPTELFSMLMVTSGTMTHRLKRLEASGLILRIPNEQDARSLLVQLTGKGMALINRAVEGHVEHERRVLATIPHAVQSDLDGLLSTLLQALEGDPVITRPLPPDTIVRDAKLPAP